MARQSLVLDIVERVTIAANRIDVWLNRAKIAAALEAGGGSQRPDIDLITLSIEAKLRRAGKGKRLVIANGAEAEINDQKSFCDPNPAPLRIRTLASRR
jgi:site-specific DNA recombinase